MFSPFPGALAKFEYEMNLKNYAMKMEINNELSINFRRFSLNGSRFFCPQKNPGCTIGYEHQITPRNVSISGPTFNCRVLTPKNDGRPSPTTDKSCALKAPGISADGSCRCTFEVSKLILLKLNT